MQGGIALVVVGRYPAVDGLSNHGRYGGASGSRRSSHV